MSAALAVRHIGITLVVWGCVWVCLAYVCVSVVKMLTLDIITHRLTLVRWIFTKLGQDDIWTLLHKSCDGDLRVTFDLHLGVKYAFHYKMT